MPLTEADLRAVLLVRAIETAAPAADGAPWRPEDAQAVGADARRQLGEQAGFELFVATRARLALARLRAQGAALQLPGDLLPWPQAWPVLGLGLGLVGERLSTDDRIQLLSWPWLVLLCWNLLVLLLALGGVLGAGWRRWRGAGSSATAAGLPDRLAGQPLAAPTNRTGGDPWPRSLTWLERGLQPVLAWLAHRSAKAAGAGLAGGAAAGAAASASWPVQARARASLALWAATMPLQRQRAMAWLHLAAAALVLGALASLYLRGLVLDFRAGWDSTFLGPEQVHLALNWLLWPATQWAGWALPPVAELAGLRWAEGVGGVGGGGGAPAAPWIHRLALSLLVMVVLPRLLLAALAAWQARRQAASLQLPPDAAGQPPYFQTLRRQAPAPLRPVCVLPYSYQVPVAAQAGLAEAAAQAFGPGAQPHCVPSLPMGTEDSLARHLPASLPPDVVALLALTATPERETHGRFLQALQASLPPGSGLQIWLDSSGFLQRLAGQPDAPQRLAQRQQAWASLLSDLHLPAASVWPLVELGGSAHAEPARAAQPGAAGTAAHPRQP